MEKFFTLNQVCDSEFGYNCWFNGNSQSVTATGKKTLATAPPPKTVADFVLPLQGKPDEITNQKVDVGQLVTLLRQELSWLFRKEEKNDVLALMLFLLGTHCHCQFESYPNLWVSIPQSPLRIHAIHSMRRLSYNGILVGSDWTKRTLLGLIETLTPTLMIERTPIRSHHPWQDLLQHSNTRERVYAKSISKTFSTYCPKIVITQNTIDPLRNENSLFLCLKPFRQTSINNEYLGEIKKQIMALVIEYSPLLISVIHTERTKMAVTLSRFPLVVLSKVLYKIGGLDEEEYNGFVEYVLTSDSHRFSQRTPEQDIYVAINQFLSVSQQSANCGFYAVADMAEYLQEVDALKNITPEWLGQFLRQRNLVLKDVRKRTQNLLRDPNKAGPKYKQMTYIKMDESLLRRLIHTKIKLI